MSEEAPASSTPFRAETTFRAFNEKQGANYAQNRRDYHETLYDVLLKYHTSTGGQFDTIMDVGTGPGTAVRTLAPRFANAIGLDPSEGMISTALSLRGVSSNSKAIRFDISTAEDLGSNLVPPVAAGSVDLITAATAAHWFDMSAFWPRAAQVLKPGGTVALWSSGPIQFDPSMPNSELIQARLDAFEETLKDYMVEGNRLTRDLYVGIPLPWALAPPVREFDEGSFLRKEWGTGGDSEPGDEFYNTAQQPVDLDTLEKIMGTGSPVVRWREAHADAVGTDRDVVRMMRLDIEQLLRGAGVEKGKEGLKGTVSGVLIMVKKKAS